MNFNFSCLLCLLFWNRRDIWAVFHHVSVTILLLMMFFVIDYSYKEGAPWIAGEPRKRGQQKCEETTNFFVGHDQRAHKFHTGNIPKFFHLRIFLKIRCLSTFTHSHVIIRSPIFTGRTPQCGQAPVRNTETRSEHKQV